MPPLFALLYSKIRDVVNRFREKTMNFTQMPDEPKRIRKDRWSNLWSGVLSAGKGMLQMGRHGENIRKRKDGRWEARLPQGHNSSGQTIYRYFYGKSYLEAKAKRNKALEGVSVNQAIPKNDLRFGQLAQEWLDAKRGTVKESTYATYANLLDKHLLPKLGTALLSSLTKQELDRFLLENAPGGAWTAAAGFPTNPCRTSGPSEHDHTVCSIPGNSEPDRNPPHSCRGPTAKGAGFVPSGAMAFGGSALFQA